MSQPLSKHSTTSARHRDQQCVTPDDLDTATHRDLHYRKPDDLDYVKCRYMTSRTPDDLHSGRHRDLHSRTPDDLDYAKRRDLHSRAPDDIDSVRRRECHSRTPDDLEYVTRKVINSRTPDDLDHMRHRDMNSRTPDDLDSVKHTVLHSRTPDDLRCRDTYSRTPDDLDSVKRRYINSRTSDDLDHMRCRDTNSRTPDELDSVIHGEQHSRTPDNLDYVSGKNMNSRTPDDLYSVRARDRHCTTKDRNSMTHSTRRSVTPDDIGSDYSHHVSTRHSGSKHNGVDSEASRMQRTKSLSSLLHSSIASWELTNKAILQPQPKGGERGGPDRLYFQSNVDPAAVCHDGTRPIDKTSSQEEGHCSDRDHHDGHSRTSTVTNVVGKHHSDEARGSVHSLDDCLTDCHVARQRVSHPARDKSPAGGSTYRYTPLRKTTNLTQSAGALSMRSKSVAYLLDDTDARVSAKTLFLNLDEKPRRYNPPAERLHSVANQGHAITSITLSASPDLVRHTTPAVAAGRSDRNVTIRSSHQSDATRDFQRNTHGFLPVEGAAQPSRHDTQLCHPTAVSHRHGGGDMSDKAVKPMTGRHTHVPSVPPVKLYHIDNV